MKEIISDYFAKQGFHAETLNRFSRVFRLDASEKHQYEACRRFLLSQGYLEMEAREADGRYFSAFLSDGESVFVNLFEKAGELTVVEEESDAYFSVSDKTEGDGESSITQFSLEDFGLSCAVRLSDGRFIIIDGGRIMEEEADKLYHFLSENSEGKPIIAAWILSHPHSDHFHCFLTFARKYASCAVIERILFNFPEYDDFAHYPALEMDLTPYGDFGGYTYIPILFERAAQTGAMLQYPHTGQKISLGNAELEILSCMDDTIHLTRNINASSLIIRMAIAGQVILWTTDASFSDARLAERYGAYLKTDILQIPHHGFQSGRPEAEIAGYKLAAPKCCILPTDDYIAYTFFCQFRPGTRFLMESEEVDEIITGNEQRTIKLPYTPDRRERARRMEMMKRGEAKNGAKCWVFSELSTACPEDFCFTVLNTAVPDANVQIDLYFAVNKQAVRYITTTAPGTVFKTIHILNGDVDGNSKKFNVAALDLRGVPENSACAVRFTSDHPIIVWHKTLKPVYYSSL